MRFKRGTLREDGMIFFGYKTGKEIWLSKEKFDDRKIKNREYVRNSKKIRMSIRKTKHKIGEKHQDENLFFLGYNKVGSPRWGTIEELHRQKEQAKIRQLRHKQKIKTMPKIESKIGDQHPIEKDLFVINITRIGTIKYGTEKQLSKVLKNNHEKNKKTTNQRRIIMSQITNKNKRGDKNIDGKIFHGYNNSGKPVWLSPEEFENKKIIREIKRKTKKEKLV